MARLLIAAGADPSARTDDGWLPHELSGDEAMANWLLRARTSRETALALSDALGREFRSATKSRRV
jgi:hypothetical protein